MIISISGRNHTGVHIHAHYRGYLHMNAGELAWARKDFAHRFGIQNGGVCVFFNVGNDRPARVPAQVFTIPPEACPGRVWIQEGSTPCEVEMSEAVAVLRSGKVKHIYPSGTGTRWIPLEELSALH